MKNQLTLYALLFVFLSGCKEKKEEVKESPISALSIIKGQLNHLDTSFYQLMKFEMQDGKTDSAYIKREEVRGLAIDFLSLKDITLSDYHKHYDEVRLIDANQNTLSITSTAKSPEEEIQKQIIIIPLDELATGKVESIFIDRNVEVKDSSFQQKLFWQIGQFFRVSSIIQKEDGSEKIHTLKVIWQ